jgi:hypothetical protein
MNLKTSIWRLLYVSQLENYSSLAMLIICHLFVQQLEGLENIFKLSSLHMELKFDEWKDLTITT